MRQRRVNAKWALGTLALALALPVVAQETPESLLPPGFGDAPAAPPPLAPPPRPAPGTPAAPVGSPSVVPILPPGFAVTQEAGDNATEGIIDDWTDEAEERAWFLFEAGRNA